MTQQVGRDGRVLESGDLIRVSHLDTPTETELKEWSQYVESVKKLIQAGARAGDGWVVNEKWVDVKGGRAFFIGDMYLPPKKQHPIPEPVSPASHQPPQTGPSAQAQPLTPIEAASTKQNLLSTRSTSFFDYVMQGFGMVLIFGLLFCILVAWYEEATKPKSCEELVQEAWDECNDDYNGKCRYLGPKYQLTCYPDEYEEALDEWKRNRW